ncbi:MAG: hypothetical protein QOG31_1884 [Thermoplasmata archaeon]|jgi:hypothetical protein|nr:hypothetical protein [Thermoplasmata archaeon]
MRPLPLVTLLLLGAVLLAAPADATIRTATGKLTGTPNGVPVSAWLNVTGDDETGRIVADFTGLSPAAYENSAAVAAPAACRLFARATGGATNLARFAERGFMGVDTVTTWKHPATEGPATHDKRFGPCPLCPHGLGPNHFVVEARVDGRVPVIPVAATLHFADYTETLTQDAPGVIHSVQKDRTYTVNGTAFTYDWDTKVTYDPAAGQLPGPQTRTTSDLVLRYDPQAQTLHIEATAVMAMQPPATTSKGAPAVPVAASLAAVGAAAAIAFGRRRAEP